MSSLEDTIRRIVAEELKQMRAPNKERTHAMSADEVAAFLGVDRKTVYDYAGRGAIPHLRLGKRLLFSRDALQAWLAGRAA